MIRSMGDKIDRVDGQKIVIGAEVPPIKVMTIELRYSPIDQDKHDKRYRALVGLLESPSPRGEGKVSLIAPLSTR